MDRLRPCGLRYDYQRQLTPALGETCARAAEFPEVSPGA